MSLTKSLAAVKKRLYALKSRSIQFLAACGALWLALPELFPLLKEALPEFVGILPDNAYRALSAIVILGALYFRFKTSRPLCDYKSCPAPSETDRKEVEQ